jgi:hypothetical protein
VAGHELHSNGCLQHYITQQPPPTTQEYFRRNASGDTVVLIAKYSLFWLSSEAQTPSRHSMMKRILNKTSQERH